MPETTHVTVTARPINRGAVIVAHAFLREIRAARVAYEEEVAAWYRSGEGRSPQYIIEFNDDGDAREVNMGGYGWTFPHCIHGTSRWTDYDNICGPCEDGESDLQRALYHGHRAWHEYKERMKVANYAIEHQAPNDATGPLITWAIEPLHVLTTMRRTVRNLP